ncbi:MAG: DUF4127 family protein [Thermaceae bacterium]
MALGVALSQGLVVYLPLDDRPPNWAPCTWGVVVCLPKTLYRGPEGAEVEALVRWLLRTPGEVLVVALDALGYGGLLQSRLLALDEGDVLLHMGASLLWKFRYGGRVLAYGIIPRWDARFRERNLDVLRAISSWPLDHLEALWDDAVRNSPAPEEAATLSYLTRPGADEGGQVLLLRALRPGLRVRVVYEAQELEGKATPYDAIPLGKTVERILKSARAVRVEEAADLTLYVYAGLDPRKAALDLMALMRGNWVALADLSGVNRGDTRLMGYLLSLGLYGRLAAYAAWGTPANNLGSALAQGGLFLRDGEARLERLAEAYLQYWWGEVGRPWVRARFSDPLPKEAEGVRGLFEEVYIEGRRISLDQIHFPWGRSFEAAFFHRMLPQFGPWDVHFIP